MKISQKTMLLIAACVCGIGVSGRAEDRELVDLKNKMKAVMQQLQELEAKQAKFDSKLVEQTKRQESAGMAAQLYGQLRLSVDGYSNDFGNGKPVGGISPGGKGTTIKSNYSRFGIQGSVPSNLFGTNLIYKAEVLYGAADNTLSEIQWREGFAGLKGGWGQARLGRFDVAYKTTLTAIDPWNDNIPQSRGFSGVQGSSALHSSFFTNTAEYMSPTLGGLSLMAWYSIQLDDETSSLHDAGPISNYQGGKAKGIGLKFNQGPWFVGADWISIDADQIGTISSVSTTNLTTGAVTTTNPFTLNTKMHNGSGWQLAAGFKQGPWSAGAFYEDVNTLGLGRNTYLTGAYAIGKTRLIATVGQNRGANQFFNRDIDTWSLGGKFALTKDSELFVAWVNRAEKAYLAPAATSAKTYQVLTVGINAKFGYR